MQILKTNPGVRRGGWSPGMLLALEVSGDAPRKPSLPLQGPPLCLPLGSRPLGAVRKVGGTRLQPADRHIVPTACCASQLEGRILHAVFAEGTNDWDLASVQACALQVTFREQIEEPVGVS